MRVGVVRIGLTLIVPFATSACGTQPKPLTLHLEERWTVDLPDSLPVVGAIPQNSEEVVVWSGARTLTCYGRHGLRWTLVLPDSSELVDVIADESDGILRAVDARGYRIFEIGSSGVLRGSLPITLDPGNRVIDAVRADRTFLLGVLDTANADYRVMSMSGTDVHELWGVRVQNASNSIREPPFRLSAAGGGVVVAEATYPFSLLFISQDLTVTSIRINGVELPSDSAGRDPMWRALRVVDLGEGAAQSHTLFSGDARRLIRYTQGWDRAVITNLDVPFAIISSRVSTRTLVAARTAGKLEIVVYAWEWRS